MSACTGTAVSRRTLLVAAAAASVPALALTACAGTPAAGGRAARVVVVGGGYGGATAARHLKLWGSDIDVTLVERNAGFVSCPLSNLVLAGAAQMADITRSHAGLQALGVTLLQDNVAAVDVARKTLRLAGGAVLAYDRLIVAPGVDFITDGIAGLAAALDSGRVLHAWKAGPQTTALRAQLQAMPDGGVFAISIPPAPFRCPPGPYERACLVASYFKQAKPRAKVLVLDANPEVQSKKALFERAFAEHHAGMLEYRPNSELREVAGSASQPIARLDFEDVQADVLNVIPPQRGADIARQAGLLNINQRWAGVHWLSMESTAAPGVHVLGDAVFPAPAMPKSGHMANQHAKVAAAAVIRLLRGQAVPAGDAAPVLANTCYSFVTASQAIHVTSVHQYDVAEQTFKTVPGSGGVSAAASVQEAREARAWAQGIWADTLGA